MTEGGKCKENVAGKTPASNEVYAMWARPTEKYKKICWLKEGQQKRGSSTLAKDKQVKLNAKM